MLRHLTIDKCIGMSKCAEPLERRLLLSVIVCGDNDVKYETSSGFIKPWNHGLGLVHPEYIVN